jgi:small multidrug resistance pump
MAAATTHPAATDRRLFAVKVVLGAAAVYNVAFGAWVVLFPLSAFALAGLPEPTYPEIWQCVGMIVGVYGIGYAIAARDPIRHWPIVLVGLLGKILGPIGFLGAIVSDRVPLEAGLIILTNDLIWWPGFALALWLAWTRRPRSA